MNYLLIIYSVKSVEPSRQGEIWGDGVPNIMPSIITKPRYLRLNLDKDPLCRHKTIPTNTYTPTSTHTQLEKHSPYTQTLTHKHIIQSEGHTNIQTLRNSPKPDQRTHSLAHTHQHTYTVRKTDTHLIYILMSRWATLTPYTH